MASDPNPNAASGATTLPEPSCPACQSIRYAKQKPGVGSALLGVMKGLGATQPAGAPGHKLLGAVGNQFEEFTCLDCGNRW